MHDLKQTAGPEKTLRLGGGFEFLSLAGEPASAYAPRNIFALYEALGYDYGLINSEEIAWLEKLGLSLPPEWLSLSRDARVEMLVKNSATVALIVFPYEKGLSDPTYARFEPKILKAAQTARQDATIVIGLSLWGAAYEESFLQRNPDALDILLGSGPGRGFSGRQNAPGQTIWVRPYTKGATVAMIDILILPGAEGGHWALGMDVMAASHSLYDSIPSSLTVLELMQN